MVPFLPLLFSFVPLFSPSLLWPLLRYNKERNHIFSYRCRIFDHRAATCVTTLKLKFSMGKAWKHNINSQS
jgi:hypothetical protein